MDNQKTLMAYSNSLQVKNQYIAQMQAHIEADELVRGGGTWDGVRGCAVGCLIHKYDHSAFEREPIQFPEWLANLIDKLHENSSSLDFSARFNLRLLAAIPRGFSDWEIIKGQFIGFILQENIERVESLNISDDLKKQVIEAIKKCKSYAESKNKLESAAESAWSAESAESAAARAASAAESAWLAASAAESAARSAESAESAARSAESAESAAARVASAAASAAESAWLAASAAESAARSAAWSAESAARSAAWSAYDRYANHLISLFKAFSEDSK